MKQYVLLICCLFNLQFSVGQSYHNLMSLGYNYHSENGVPENNKVSLAYFRASLPLKLKNGDYFLLNPDLHRQAFRFASNKKIVCTKTGLTLAYLKMTAHGNVIALLNLSHNSEKGQAGFHAMEIGGGFLVMLKKSKQLKLKYGLYVNREFFGPIIVPLFGLDYKINSKYRLYGILPQNLRIEYCIHDHFRTGILLETPVNSYMLGNSSDRIYLDQRQILCGIYQDIYLGKNMALQMSLKQPFSNQQHIFRKNQIFDAAILGIGTGGERSADNTAIDAMKYGLLCEISLNYRIELE